MNLLDQFYARFIDDEEGATAVEYAVMLALIIAACLAAVGSLGEATGSSFGNARDRINAATAGDP